MGDLWRAYATLNKVIAKGAARSGAALSQAVNDHASGRGARRGILAPGDPAPPPSAGGSYYDYRGVLNLRTVPPYLRQAEFPLGRYVHPARGPREPIAIPAAVVAHHAAVVGPAGSGKTRFVIVPWIVAALRAGWSVVTIDVKGNLADLVKEAARASGRPLGIRPDVLDYTRPASSIRWSWLAELDSDRAIDNAVQSILGKQPPPQADPYFFHAESQILRGLLELVRASPRRDRTTASRVLEVLNSQDKLTRILANQPGSPAAARLRDLPRLDRDDYAKRVTGVAVRLDALAKPMVEAVTSQAGLRVDEILRSRRLVSIVAPLQDGQMAATLSSLFVNQLLFRAYDRFANPGGVPVLLVLDEAAQLESRVDFEGLLSVAREAQVAALVAVQDVAQLKDANQRSIVFANCGTMISMRGVSSESAKLLSQRVGDHPVQTSSTSTGPAASGWGNATSRSVQTQMAPVVAAREIMDLPIGKRPAMVHSRQVAGQPFLVELEPS